ncbi:VCBS repeat-containing protein [Streptomyces sp. NPDC048002]|uniref:FG-GAP repeat domain-containing protein n=1 Tax=Streptomyces sp. NPDC048002 TaxID=3154344 RepID=UPI0033DFA5CF
MSVRRGSVVVLALLGATLTAPPSLAHAQHPALTQDFNGDGYEDQVTGVPVGTVAGKKRAGYIAVVYGSARGPGTRKVYSQASPGIPGGVEYHDMFGAHLTVGDYDGDGYPDLLVETDNEQWTQDGIARDGHRTILWGGPKPFTSGKVLPALTTSRYQGSITVAGDFDGDGHQDLARQDDVRFGPFGRDGRAASAQRKAPFILTDERTAVASGDTDGDGITDVVTLAREYESNTEHRFRYEVTVARGSASGLLPPTAVTTFQAKDPWDESLAVGDVDGDGRDEIVTGGTSEILVLDGGSARLIDQDTPGVPGAEETGDRFGGFVSVGDVDGDGYGDIVAGNPSEDFGGLTDAGNVAVLPGGPDGPTGAGTVVFSQASAGVPGAAESNDRFGSRTDLVDGDGDGLVEPVVSAVGENDWAGGVWLFSDHGVRSFGGGSFGMPAADSRFGDRFPQ